MAIPISVPPSLYEALKAEGFLLPDECADVRLLMPVDGIWQMQYRVNLSMEDFEKVSRAFIRIANDRKV